MGTQLRVINQLCGWMGNGTVGLCTQQSFLKWYGRENTRVIADLVLRVGI